MSILEKNKIKHMNKLVVLLDAGHGITTPGKRSPDGVIREYKYNRELVDAIYNKLLEIDNINPIKVVPELQDIPLKTRVQRINKYVRQCSQGTHCIMISVHLNAAGNGQWMNARGWCCYTTRGQNNSDKLSTCLYEAAKDKLQGHKIRTDYSDGDPDWEAGFYIIKYSNCVSVLSENLFMDNKEDYNYLLTEQGFNSIVDLHVKGIELYKSKYIK